MKPAAADPCFRPCVELLRHAAPLERQRRALEELLRQDSDRVIRFLSEHRIDQHIYRRALALRPAVKLPEALAEALQWAQRRAAVNTLMQEEAGRQVAAALEGAGVRHVFYKGAHLGEALYGDAVVRPAADIDVLISEEDRPAALDTLGQHGFSTVEQAGQPPYEMALDGHGSQLDLHWHLFRPARSRQPLTQWILDSRQQLGERWVPDDTAALAIMLLSPALTDHVTQQLSHAIDLDRWLRSRDTDWPRVVSCLAECGLRTAAWTMLEWTRRHFATPVPQGVLPRLAPGPLRRAYLKAWLTRDPARRYLRHPWLVRGGFSLALHDRPADMLRAVRGGRSDG
ncbi:MAG: nucleotidyltransferase family protein [Acidobacteriota bacterium]